MHVSIPGEAIGMDSVRNLRDLGGWATVDGRTVRSRTVLRAAGLATASAEDLDQLAALGVTTVIDLRTEAERTTRPDRVPPGATLLVADVLADHVQAAPAHLEEILLSDPPTATELLADGRAEELMGTAYRGFVSLPSARASYRTVFETLQHAEGAVLVHCTTGKDRTGWASAVLLLLLGVPEANVVAEYLLTNDQLLPRLGSLFERFAEGGGDPAVLRPIFGVRESYLRIALTELATAYGTIEAYFSDGLGIDAAAQERLRARLLAPS